MSPADHVRVGRLDVGRREYVTRRRIERLEAGRLRGDPRLDAVGVRLAQRLRPGPSPTSSSPAASPAGRDGTSWSWIQRIQLPSGAREGSTAIGWPTTIVASAGNRPRSASLTARETPFRPGREVDDRRPAEPRVAVPARRLREREVDLHLAPAVPEPLRFLRDRPAGRPQQVSVQRLRRHRRRAPPASPRSISPSAVRTPVARSALDDDLVDLPPGLACAARVADDPGQRLDQPDAAAARHRHPAELDRDADHLRHEAGRRRRPARARCAAPTARTAPRHARPRTSPRVQSRQVDEHVARRTRRARADRAGAAPSSRAARRRATTARCRARRRRGRRSA